VADSKEALALAKAKLTPAITKGQFAVFVFGPALSTDNSKPGGAASSHSEVVKHAQYLRFLTRERLREMGFAADYGEAEDILNFWQKLFSSPNTAASEVLHARHVCGAIIIFPASVGSIAELGLFVHKGDIAQKTLAIVHRSYDGASSFFRRGLLELFTIFSGRREFVDYSDHEACLEEAVRFVKGQYYRQMDEIADLKWLTSRNLGTVFDHAMGRSSD
jgi:hypothetical protein